MRRKLQPHRAVTAHVYLGLERFAADKDMRLSAYIFASLAAAICSLWSAQILVPTRENHA